MFSDQWIFHIFIISCIITQIATSDSDNDVIVINVASNRTDGYERYLRSTRVYGFEDKVITLGLDKPWKGGNMNSVGGGYKINLLKKELKKYKNDQEKLIIFTDSYDVIFSSDLDTIIKKFKIFDARILFAAEKSCWPDKELKSKYPSVYNGDPYLNSGGFIGYASDLYEILNTQEIGNTDDDQLFYTHIYLNLELRNKHKIKLDHKSEIFQNLHESTGDIELRFKENEAYIQNIAHNTVPSIIHGNGLSKTIFNSLGNYLAKAWSPEEGCMNCWDKTIELLDEEVETYPPIVIAVFIDRPTPFLEEFLDKVQKQTYPKSKLFLFVYNNEVYHDGLVRSWIDKYGDKYKSLKVIHPDDQIDVSTARNLALNYCLLKECSGYFSIDSVAHLDNEYTLKLLVEQQRGIVAPLLVRPGKTWSNFWGAVADNGYYARSSDYMEIIENKRRGLWNVPYINNCYLINVTIIDNPATRPLYNYEDLDPDMAFAVTNRYRQIFMYVSNRLEFGHLVNPEYFNTQYTNPDVYEIFNNKYDWEKRYIHENYSSNFDLEAPPHQPCPDVYWFPIVTDRFTKEFVEIMEAYGQWSDGSNKDPRLQGGYENVPTRDIHMNQVDYEPHWLYFLKEYVRPLQELVFIGYYHDPPRSLMNFVVRYRPDEQPSLRPHHDSSTYTINIALNQVGVDYEGGGCRFLRYNCSVTDTKRGWMLMHPGRLTHYHEGLLVTKGTRYIMISFVDP
ncbi:procollagen-lysine,2-oxoglutarate 5-dioxygenase isoform X1 [Chelonus insularis]|uniref:procollagen-lysine,2-oxoglutarate 5-dioxygenase isoform X1 n=1 Tax=Chelonus insularis TaxID=460826 RepID=UPI00158C6840|nr:procollagen-lysine,2-oxoglutarate 5-dioxygenase isoform X1 [Chelonus insularis]